MGRQGKKGRPPFALAVAGAALATGIGVSLAVAAEGDLTYAGCITGDTQAGPSPGSGACTKIPSASSGGAGSGLDVPSSVTVSSDGKSVYAASQVDAGIARFDRNPSSGALSYQGCISGNTAAASCTQIPSASSGGTNSGLNYLQSGIVTADGKSVYAVSYGDAAIARFDRNPSSGALSYMGCISGNAAAASCTQIPGASSNGTGSGLYNLLSVAASADGKSVYAVSQGDDAIARFDRNPSSGALSYQGCISGDTAAASCTQIPSASLFGNNSGLDALRSVAVSADGKSVYALAENNDAVARFDRDPSSGVLSYQGCISGNTAAASCTQIPGASSGGRALASIAPHRWR